MKHFGWTALVLLGTLLLPQKALAESDFSGPRPLLFATTKVLECSKEGECREVTLKEADLPRFSIVDFKKKLIRPTPESGINRTSVIESITHIEGKLILQGAENGVRGVRDGVGWSIAISEETGDWVLTASGEDVAFVVYGASTPWQ